MLIMEINCVMFEAKVPNFRLSNCSVFHVFSSTRLRNLTCFSLEEVLSQLALKASVYQAMCQITLFKFLNFCSGVRILHL